MTLPTGSEQDFTQAKRLLEEYSFDLSGFQAGELVAIWQECLGAEASWIRAAVLEALYQGRYKAFSVEQILQGWKRRGHPVRHFNSEFERLVFGPIDPTISKYASMTTLSPSALMSPQSTARSVEPTSSQPVEGPSPGADGEAAEPPSDSSSSPSDDGSTEVNAADGAPSPSFTEPIDPLTVMAYSDSTYASSLFHHPAPIQKFEPYSEASGFYQRLQSVARHA